MKILKHTLLAAVAVSMLTACNDDGYWSQYKAPEEYYAFPKTMDDITFTSANVPSTFDVRILRSEAGDEVTIPVEATFSIPELSGPSSVTFAKGSREAIYTIAVNPAITQGTYTVDLEIPAVPTSYEKDADPESDSYVPNELPSESNLYCSVTFNYDYIWASSGSAMVESLDWAAIGIPVKVPVQKATDYTGQGQLFRLYNCYALIYAKAGVSKAAGYGVQFIVDDNGDALKIPSPQNSGLTNGQYNVYWVWGNSSAFINQGNIYMATLLEGAYLGGVYQGGFGYEQLYWEWTEGYPF